MTKTLLTSVATLVLVFSFAGIAQARERGHDYQPSQQSTTSTSTTWIYSSLCKAAVPVSEVYHYEHKSLPPMASYRMMPNSEKQAGIPLTVVGEADYSNMYIP